MESDDKLVLMDSERITRSLKRIAHQIREQNRKDKPIILIGINERGYIVSQKLGEILSPLCKASVEVQQIIIKKGNGKADLDVGIKEDGFLVVVDDVIFSGKTMFKALKHLSDQPTVSEIHTVVLIDRGHRKLPIKAEFSGMELPTKLNEHVAVKVEKGELKNVLLEKQSSG